jgi:hypothetical protein
MVNVVTLAFAFARVTPPAVTVQLSKTNPALCPASTVTVSPAIGEDGLTLIPVVPPPLMVTPWRVHMVQPAGHSRVMIKPVIVIFARSPLLPAFPILQTIAFAPPAARSARISSAVRVTVTVVAVPTARTTVVSAS